MPLWGIYLKSHCIAPDFEAECEAATKEEAIKILLNDYPALNEFRKEDLKDYVEKIED